MIEASIALAVLSAIDVLFSDDHRSSLYTVRCHSFRLIHDHSSDRPGRSMLVNLNSRRAEGATSQGSSSRKTTVASVHRKTAQEFNLSSLGVRRDVETHYQMDTIPLENPDYGFQKAHDIENQRHPNAAVFNL
jgi:hypothetical protein